MKLHALRIPCLLLVVSVVCPCIVRAQAEVFVQITSIPGESVHTGHVNWIDAFALSQSATNPLSGEPGAGAPSFSEIAVLKGTDQATPRLHSALALGTNLGLVKIDVCGTPLYGEARCYYKLELTNTRVTGIALSGAASCTGAGACAPAQTESVSFFYTKIKWCYAPPGGGLGECRCWDLATNSTC